MELAISAVSSDLVSRFITFFMNKFSGHVCSEEKVERLQQLLLRVQTVVEEADGRYITNSCMLVQLKTLAAAMYRAYYVLDTIRYHGQHKKSVSDCHSHSCATALSFSSRLERSRASNAMKKVFNFNLDLKSAVENLEVVVDNMTEFIILLSGCDRMLRKPYDTYLYLDNFMFGRHAEKQQLLNVLLQHDDPDGPLAVIPVIGGHRVGKKTLVAHVCRDERVRSHFCHVVHLNGDNFLRIGNHERQPGRALVVVEFVSDVDDSDWETFYTSVVTDMDRGSKVIIISQIEKIERFGSVRPILLNNLPYEEYRYLFKTLAFGSANPMYYPELLQMVEEFPMLLAQSLMFGYCLADLLRRNLTARFWLCRLNAIRWMVINNLSMFGTHPYVRFSQQGLPVHMSTDFVMSDAAPVASDVKTANVSKNDVPKVFFRDIGEGRVLPPTAAFNLVTWESRIPPYRSFVRLVQFTPKRVDGMPERTMSGRKRPAAVLT